MYLFINVCLFKKPFTKCFISEDMFMLPDEESYRSIGLNVGDSNSYIKIKDEDKGGMRRCRLRAPAFFLQPFFKEFMYSETYRTNVLKNLCRLTGSSEDSVIFLKLILEPPDKELIDFSWNDRMLRLIWTRVEIENAFSWLSTLGGAYSALGDYFEHCADEAGRISIRQYKLSLMLGDESLAARSRLYSALAHAQKGNLKVARRIVRQVAAFAGLTRDHRLNRMCQGVWAKLKYLRQIQNAGRNICGRECGDVKIGSS